jgi:molybdopterin-guanine dinucleotide biosynthesis protein A
VKPLVVGVVLAGGRSRRLGRDKARLEVEVLGRRRTLLAWTVERLRACGLEVAVAAGPSRVKLPAPLEVSPIEDGPGRGPAAGVLGAAAAYPQSALLVLGCDLPLVPVSLLTALLRRFRNQGCDLVSVDAGQGVEPLCTIYSRRALEVLRHRAAAGDTALHPLFSVAGLEVGFEPAPPEWLLNINTPEDLAKLAALEGWSVH